MSADRIDVRIDVVEGRVYIGNRKGFVLPPGAHDAIAALAGDIRRAVAPPLPPRDAWPDEWREIYDERLAICLEAGGAPADAEAVADAELRVWAWTHPR